MTQRLSEALEEWLLARTGEVSARTLKTYRKRGMDLIHSLGDRPAGELTVGELRRWRADLVTRSRRTPPHDGPLSVWSVRGIIRTCKIWFRWLHREGLIPEDPMARLQMPPAPSVMPKAVSDDDLTALLAAARQHHPRDYALVCFLAETGCRAGGAAGLRLGDLDIAAGRAIVREKGRGGKKARTVFFGDVTRAALAAWLSERAELEPATDRMFTDLLNPDRGITPSGIYQALGRLAQRAGIEGRFNPHSFRHGFARRLLQNGADLGTVSQLMGHSDIAVTSMFYARWSAAELQERYHRFNRLPGAAD